MRIGGLKSTLADAKAAIAALTTKRDGLAARVDSLQQQQLDAQAGTLASLKKANAVLQQANDSLDAPLADADAPNEGLLAQIDALDAQIEALALGDLNEDRKVTGFDLAYLLLHWGDTPQEKGVVRIWHLFQRK